MAELHETDWGEERDYTLGSPQLQHVQLRSRIERDLTTLVEQLTARHGCCRALEVGAGHGTFTRALVSAGATVTVTEMSEPSVRVLKQAFAENPDVTVLYDPEGDLPAKLAADFELAVFVSVLHHIPNYVGVVRDVIDRMPDGAAFYSAQDPLFYSRLTRINAALSCVAYMLWRLGQGEIKRGLATRWRRLRGIYDETKSADMVEYHVIRQGVDEQALEQILCERFDDVRLWTYWSTQSGLLQRLGEQRAAGWASTFGLTAVNHRRQPVVPVRDPAHPGRSTKQKTSNSTELDPAVSVG